MFGPQAMTRMHGPRIGSSRVNQLLRSFFPRPQPPLSVEEIALMRILEHARIDFEGELSELPRKYRVNDDDGVIPAWSVKGVAQYRSSAAFSGQLVGTSARGALLSNRVQRKPAF